MLFRFDPFDTMNQVDRRSPSVLAMDAVRTDDAVFVYFDAPGVDPDDMELTVERNEITVETSRRWNDPDSHTLTSERAQGVFRRRIQVGDNLDTDKLEARLDQGVLTLEIPLKEDTKPRSVSISSESESTQPELVSTSLSSDP